MADLPSIGYRKVLKAFGSLGWKKARQAGSHIILVKEGHWATLSVPADNPVAKGTLRSLIRSAGITVEQFVGAMK
jgi:predicted RNA binding protein YcfA (HicA-like mRNA interferase family)